MSPDTSFPYGSGPAGAPVASGAPEPVIAPATTVEERDFSWLRLILGLATVVIGVLVIAWPQATVTVVAVLFGINLFIDGLIRVLQAALTSEGGVLVRVLYALLGLVSIVLGVLCLRHLLQTVQIIVLLVGLSWVIAGVIEIIVGLASGPPSSWNVTTALLLGSGVIALIAGIVVLTYPKLSLGTFVVLMGVSLVVYGGVSVVTAIRQHADHG